MEQWKKIDGYDNYSVSDMGRVRNDVTGTVLKCSLDTYGYQKVMLYPEKKMMRVHRLVAIAFIPNPGNLPQVNHRNEDKTDNRVDNLEWCTAEYNNRYGTHMKCVRENQPHSKRCIVDGIEYTSIMEATRQLNIPKNSLSMALVRGQNHYKGHTICYC